MVYNAIATTRFIQTDLAYVIRLLKAQSNSIQYRVLYTYVLQTFAVTQIHKQYYMVYSQYRHKEGAIIGVRERKKDILIPDCLAFDKSES